MSNLDLGQLFYAAVMFIASSLHTVGLWWLNRRFRSIFLLTRGYDYTEQSTKNILLNSNETMAPRRNEVQQKNDNNKMNLNTDGYLNGTSIVHDIWFSFI